MNRSRKANNVHWKKFFCFNRLVTGGWQSQHAIELTGRVALAPHCAVGHYSLVEISGDVCSYDFIRFYMVTNGFEWFHLISNDDLRSAFKCLPLANCQPLATCRFCSPTVGQAQKKVSTSRMIFAQNWTLCSLELWDANSETLLVY